MSGISLIVAVDKNGAIGLKGKMPWHLPADLARFKSLTWGKPVVMGRKTYDSIGRALPGRRNVVITRNPEWKTDDVERVTAFSGAMSVCGDDKEIMVIGGASIYRLALPFAETIYLTRVIGEVEADVYFPMLNPNGWDQTLCSHYPADRNHRYAMDFLTLIRRAPR